MLIKKNKLNNFYLNLSKNLRISVKKYLSFQTTLLQDKRSEERRVGKEC